MSDLADTSQFIWTGEPILYPRSLGRFGLVLGAFHYLFHADGSLQSLQPVTRPIMQKLVGSLYPNGSAMLAAHLKPMTLLEDYST